MTLLLVCAAGFAQPAPADAPVEASAGPEQPAAGAPDVGEDDSDVTTPEARFPLLFPGQCEPGDPHFDLEVMYHEGKMREGLGECETRLRQAADADLYWMKARFLFEIGEQFDRTDTSIDKIAHYESMRSAADAGLALRPGDPHLRFARGIALGRIGTTRGVLSSLFLAKDVERDWQAAIKSEPYSSIGGEEMLPGDAYHALGIFYRLVPDWWIVGVIAGTKGDLDRSLEYHQRAVAYKRDIPNLKELGVTQLCIGDRRDDAALLQAGDATLAEIASLPTRSERDKVDAKHAVMLRRDPSLACEYSRDGQQDLDKDKLPEGESP